MIEKTKHRCDYQQIGEIGIGPVRSGFQKGEVGEIFAKYLDDDPRLEENRKYYAGAGLRALADFFPNAEIHGFDIAHRSVKEARERATDLGEKQTRSYVLNSLNRTMVDSVMRGILSERGHTANQIGSAHDTTGARKEMSPLQRQKV